MTLYVNGVAKNVELRNWQDDAGEETEIFGEYDGTEVVFWCDEL